MSKLDNSKGSTVLPLVPGHLCAGHSSGLHGVSPHIEALHCCQDILSTNLLSRVKLIEEYRMDIEKGYRLVEYHCPRGMWWDDTQKKCQKNEHFDVSDY